ncbi:MAG: hypothetical protein QOJ56_3643, partial [Mycobacterium sp.]|nr:hypothetical protein [Mycobacterium sp.]
NGSRAMKALVSSRNRVGDGAVSASLLSATSELCAYDLLSQQPTRHGADSQT